MIYNKHLYVSRIKKVAEKLDYLLKEAVFVGGAVVALYADDPAAEEVRPTDDIDIVVGISTRAGFSTFEEKLRELGFKNDIESKFIGRYKINGIIVDFMPIEENVLGFSNRWYKAGIEQSFLYTLESNISIRLMPFHYFIASKIEAHRSRNGADLRTSKDFEDIVYSFDNRLDPLKDLLEAEGEVAFYLKKQLMDFMESPDFDEGVYCHLAPGSDARFKRIKRIWIAFTIEGASA